MVIEKCQERESFCTLTLSRRRSSRPPAAARAKRAPFTHSTRCSSSSSHQTVTTLGESYTPSLTHRSSTHLRLISPRCLLVLLPRVTPGTAHQGSYVHAACSCLGQVLLPRCTNILLGAIPSFSGMIRRLLVPFIIARGSLGAQPSAPAPVAAPLRELPWAQLNFLHTTDIHGWWGGHLQE